MRHIPRQYQSGAGRIILPRKVYVLQEEHEKIEEYNIYFHNIISGKVDYDLVQVECNYGQQHERFWKIQPTEVGEFDLAVATMNEDYEVKQLVNTKVEVVPRRVNTPCNVVFVGDSITRGNMYVKHIQDTLQGVKSLGIRTYDEGITNVEGRGGWCFKDYFEGGKTTLGDSPFMFPKGVPAEKYRGNTAFFKQVAYIDSDGYNYQGFQKIARGWKGLENPYLYNEEGYPIAAELGDVVCNPYLQEGDKFETWNGEKWVTLEEQPEWELSFEKYVTRYQDAFIRAGEVEKIHMVSILMGANDLKTTEDLEDYIQNMRVFIKSIKAYDEDIKIIINMPLCGTTQDGFGRHGGCNRTAEYYRRIIQLGNEAILKEWDNEESVREGIYISPMMLGLDPIYGFERVKSVVHKYNDLLVEHPTNDVHPNQIGHHQMGDMLGATIQYIRNLSCK